MVLRLTIRTFEATTEYVCCPGLPDRSWHYNDEVAAPAQNLYVG